MSQLFRVLVAVDDTEATEHALAYAGAVLGGRDDARLFALHVLGPLPEDLRVPKGEAITEEQRDRQALWMVEARKDAKPLLEKARRILEKAGVDGETIEVKATEVQSSEEVPRAISRPLVASLAAPSCLGGSRSHGRRSFSIHTSARRSSRRQVALRCGSSADDRPARSRRNHRRRVASRT